MWLIREESGTWIEHYVGASGGMIVGFGQSGEGNLVVFHWLSDSVVISDVMEGVLKSPTSSSFPGIISGYPAFRKPTIFPVFGMPNASYVESALVIAPVDH